MTKPPLRRALEIELLRALEIETGAKPAASSQARIATAQVRQDTALLAKVRECLSFAVNVLCTLPRTAFDAQRRNALIRAADDIYDAVYDIDRHIDMRWTPLVGQERRLSKCLLPCS